MNKLPKKLARIKIFFLGLIVLFVPFLIGHSTSSVLAQSPIRCGLINETCCNFAGREPDSCQTGLICTEGTCLPTDPNNVPSDLYRGGIRPKTIHSLRPSPAEPWDDEVHETALFCGNDLVVVDNITVSRENAISCTPTSDGYEKCKFSVDRVRDIVIDLSGADFPIAGNTEDVVNSSLDTDLAGFDDAGKMNEYLSWYLNGTLNRAEYEFLDAEDKEDLQRLVDYSGPINKLLPWDQQARYRINTIYQAKETRNDQVVACTTFLRNVPAPCYNQELLNIINKHLLTEWKTNRPIIPGASFFGSWLKKTPPFREDFDTFIQYWKAYKEWRGDTCFRVVIPIVNKEILLCGDNPFKPNYWADLFPYIPLSSTEDRIGLVETDTINTTSTEDVTITNMEFSNQEPAELFFAHTEEVTELASILQKTFVPQGQENNLAPSGVAIPDYCDLVNIRTNAGDNLYAGEISGTLSYTAEFTCTLGPPGNDCEDAGGICLATSSCQEVNGGGGCLDSWLTCCSRTKPRPTDSCTKPVYANMSVVTKTPKANEMWGRLVAGSSAVFKKIFPQVGPYTDLGCILDIPGATKVTYEGDGLIRAGNPGAERSGESAELYFPHLGGVYEYFLKGIQTILRPKGFGEGIVFGSPGDPRCILSTNGDVCPEDCNPDPTSVDMSGIENKFLDLANRWFDSGTARVELYDQVVNTALSAGVDPIFALAIWLHESGASNYAGICTELGGGDPSAGYCQLIQDFGINVESDKTVINSNGDIIVDNFRAQLDRFTIQPAAFLTTCDQSQANCAWEIFGARYRDGTCTPSEASNNWLGEIFKVYRWLAPGQQLPCYATELPN